MLRTCALICALALPAGAPARAAAPNATLLEVAQYFTGTWTCKTERGSFAIHNFLVELGGRWMTMHNRFEAPGGVTGEFDEYYGFTAATGTWTLSVFGSDGSLANEVAHGWTGASWHFSGTTQSEGHTLPARLTYTKASTSEFGRTLETQVAGQWQKTSAETCNRR